MRSNSRSKIQNLSFGFTLVELLVVIAILGILATIGLVTFSSSQMRGRDAQRKSDLKQVSSALEIYYNDSGEYLDSLNGLVLGCPTTTATSCTWGAGQMKDANTIYLKTMPKDPSSNLNYFYRSVAIDGVSQQGFQVYAHLENSQDNSACIGGNCGVHTDLPAGVTCGGVSCNFAITSPNVTPLTN
jgi:prepilin-type N-terminal cleavage/methylation domain-containing protein